jgi:hypothetical protein
LCFRIVLDPNLAPDPDLTLKLGQVLKNFNCNVHLVLYRDCTKTSKSSLISLGEYVRS